MVILYDIGLSSTLETDDRFDLCFTRYFISSILQPIPGPGSVLQGPLAGAGGVSQCQMSIIRNVNVVLSNLRNGHVALSI